MEKEHGQFEKRYGEQKQPKSEIMRARTINKTTDSGLPTPFGIHISQQCALGAGHGTVAHTVCPA